MAGTTNNTSVERLNASNRGKLPDYLGLEVTAVAAGRVEGRFAVTPAMIAPNGFLFAGVLLSIADLLCAYGVGTVWPEGATGFTTAEVKCNFLGTAREGEVRVVAMLLHGGRTTQVWDADCWAGERRIAAFRCTQIVLYPRGEAKGG